MGGKSPFKKHGWPDTLWIKSDRPFGIDYDYDYDNDYGSILILVSGNGGWMKPWPTLTPPPSLIASPAPRLQAVRKEA
jgi:hypothetical protein